MNTPAQDIFIRFIAAASLLYGSFALLTGRLFPRDLKKIPEKYRKRYARLCGVVLLLEFAALAAMLYLEEKGLFYAVVHQPVTSVLFLSFGLLPMAVLLLGKKILIKT